MISNLINPQNFTYPTEKKKKKPRVKVEMRNPSAKSLPIFLSHCLSDSDQQGKEDGKEILMV